MGLPARINTLFRKLVVLLPLGIIGYFVFSFVATDRRTLFCSVHVSPGYLALAMLLSIVPWFTGSLRLFIWSRFFGRQLPYPALFRIAISAELGAAVTPPAIGGGAVKIGMLMQQGMAGGTALSIAVLEGLEDTVFFLIMVPLALTASSSWNLPLVRKGLSGMQNPVFWSCIAGIALAIGVLFLARKANALSLLPWPRALSTAKDGIMTWLRETTAACRLIGKKGKVPLLITFVLTAAQWICRYSIISVLLAGIGLPAQPILFMALQVIVFALMTVVPTPGGAGGAEALFYFFYRSLIPGEAMGVVITAWRFFTFYFLLILAAVLLLILGMQPATVKRPAEEPTAVL